MPQTIPLCRRTTSGTRAMVQIVIRGVTAVMLLIALCSSEKLIASDGSYTQDALRKWIKTQIRASSGGSNDPRLSVRREPVRPFIHSDIAPAGGEATEIVKAFSDFSDLPIEFGSRSPNLIIVITTPINDGNKPNWRLFRRLGLPDFAVNIVGESGEWASGCGIYTFFGEKSEVSLSLVLVEKSLVESRLMDCLVSGIIAAFGLRAKVPNPIRASDGFFQYLLLAKALRRCDLQIDGDRGTSGREDLEARYVDCMTEQLFKLAR